MTPTTKTTRTGRIRTGFKVQGVRYGADEWKEAYEASKRTGCRVVRLARAAPTNELLLQKQLDEARRVLGRVNDLLDVFTKDRVLIRDLTHHALGHFCWDNVQKVLAAIESGDLRIAQARRLVLGEKIATNAAYGKGGLGPEFGLFDFTKKEDPAPLHATIKRLKNLIEAHVEERALARGCVFQILNRVGEPSGYTLDVPASLRVILNRFDDGDRRLAGIRG
jgi:hypothetical protein